MSYTLDLDFTPFALIRWLVCPKLVLETRVGK